MAKDRSLTAALNGSSIRRARKHTGDGAKNWRATARTNQYAIQREHHGRTLRAALRRWGAFGIDAPEIILGRLS